MSKILVVDDEKDVRETLCSALIENGFSPVDAPNGTKAIELFKTEAPALVLLDLRMPDMDGIETMEKLKYIDPNIPIIILTAFGEVPVAVKAIKLGADDFLTKPPDLEVFLSKIRRSVDNAREIVNKRDVKHENTLLNLDNWSYFLKIYTFGQFKLLKQDKPLDFTGKVQQRPICMLKTIIALGCTEITETQLTDALWPEADGDSAHQSFKTTLHRLRQMLGCEKAIRLQEGRITLDPQYTWVDSLMFQRIVDRVDDIWSENHMFDTENNKIAEFAVKLSQKAFNLYKGDFLSMEENKPWATTMRERFRARFIPICEKLGNYYESKGRWLDSIECCQKALEVNDLMETQYRRIMACYRQLGRKAEALATYNRCRKILSNKLGIEPSRETRAIADTLKSKF
ncbi:MAG: response regulator [Nitrospirae bacterium]|nr:response regulator [Nitrospirota bacterium]